VALRCTTCAKGIAGLAALPRDVLRQKPRAVRSSPFAAAAGDRLKLSCMGTVRAFASIIQVMERGPLPLAHAMTRGGRPSDVRRHLHVVGKALTGAPDWGAPPARRRAEYIGLKRFVFLMALSRCIVVAIVMSNVTQNLRDDFHPGRILKADELARLCRRENAKNLGDLRRSDQTGSGPPPCVIAKVQKPGLFGKVIEKIEREIEQAGTGP